MDGGVGGRRSEPASEQAGRGVTESGPARHRGHGGAGGPPGAAAAAWPLQAVADVSVGQDKDEMVFVFKNSRDLRPADTQSLCQKDRRRCAHGPRLHLCTKVCAASRGMSGTSTSSSLEEVTLPVSMLTRTKPSASCGASVRADVRSGARLRQHGAGLHTLRRRPCRGTLLHRRGPGPYPPPPPTPGGSAAGPSGRDSDALPGLLSPALVQTRRHHCREPGENIPEPQREPPRQVLGVEGPWARRPRTLRIFTCGHGSLVKSYL